MKIKVRLLAFVLAAVLLLPLFPVGASAQTGDDASYTKNKVVSVLFDNSGSMNTDGKWNYARYALETLMTTLGKNDTLIIVPMNKNSNINTTGEHLVVDLAAENRTKVINDIFFSTESNKPFLSKDPSGATPSETIEVAIQQLVARGMKTTAQMGADEKSDNEYFLVVLTDGVFNPPGSSSEIKNPVDLMPYFAKDLTKYASFQSIYIGFSNAALSLKGDPSNPNNPLAELDKAANFSAYKAEGSHDIGEVMKQVANRITGRYPLNVQIDKNSKTIRIPLNDVGFSLRSVTVMVTNSNARYDKNVGASYNGTPLTVSQEATFQPLSGMSGMLGGFTAILTRGGSDAFSGGEIVLPLDEAPGANATVSVLLEPALLLSPIVECQQNGVWKTVDAAYINSNLTKQDKIRLSYEITEQGTGTKIDMNSVFGETVARVTYNTKSYDVGQEIQLAEGKHEIGLSVSVMDGAYSLYASFPCVVLANPRHFRVEGRVTPKSKTLFETTFTVYNNNQPIGSLAELEDFKPEVTATREDGSTYPLAGAVQKNPDGTFTVTVDVSGEPYGTYTLHASVKSKEGNPRSVDVPIGYYPTGLTLTHTGASKIERTLHGILSNTEGYSFDLSAQDTKIPFDNALLSYTLTVGGTDVTSKATINGNTLTFVPTAEALGSLAETTGEHTVKLKVVFSATTTETVETTATLALTPTVFEVVPLEPTGAVDRFALKKNQNAIFFQVLRDGTPLSEAELQAALDAGDFYLDHGSYRSFLSPVRTELTVESYRDTPVVRVRPMEGQFFLLRGLVTSMLVFGNSLEIDAYYGEDVSATGVISLTSPGILPYLWRILLILYIIQLIILIATFGRVKRIPQGVFVRVPILDYEKEETELKGKVIIIKQLGLKEYLILKRLIPYVGLCFWKKDIPTSEGTLKYHQNAGVCIGGGIKCMEGEMKPNGAIVSTTLKNKGWGALKAGTSFTLNKVALSGFLVKITQKTSKANIDQPLTGTRGLVVKNKFYLFVSARAVGKKK